MKQRIVDLLMKLVGATFIVSLSDGREYKDAGQLGFRIFRMNFWYYKWSDPMFSNARPWRVARKREFGEVVLSVKMFPPKTDLSVKMLPPETVSHAKTSW